MKVNKSFIRYVDEIGSVRLVADQTGYSVGYIYNILRGRRNVGKKFAEVIEKKTRGKFKKQDLIF